MECVINYFNEKLPGFNEQKVNISADGKSFWELASDIYDDMLTDSEILNDVKECDYQQQSGAEAKYKSIIIESISLFVKHCIGIIYALLDQDMTETFNNANAFSMKIDSDKILRKMKNMCLYSDELSVSAFTNNFFHKKDHTKGISFAVNKTHQFMIETLLDYPISKDLLAPKYCKYDNFIVAEGVFEILMQAEKDAVLQLYLWNRVAYYPLIDVFIYSISEFEEDRRMDIFIKAFYKFGYQKIYRKEFKRAKELIYKSMLYDECIRLTDKYYLNKGYILIGAPTETKFKTLSTIEDYIDTLNADEKEALKGINQSSDIRAEKRLISAELDSLFNKVIFAFHFSELLSAKVIKSVTNHIVKLSDCDKIKYVRTFYENINIDDIPSYAGIIKKYDKIHMMTILNQKEIKSAVLESIGYFADTSKYLQSLYKKKAVYNKLKSLTSDEKNLHKIRDAIKDLEEIKKDDFFPAWKYAVKVLNKDSSDEVLCKYYPQIYKFFEKHHKKMAGAFIAIGEYCTKFPNFDDDEVNEQCNILCDYGTPGKGIKDIGHYLRGFRRSYKFDFNIKDISVDRCAMKIKEIIEQDI